MGRAIVREPKVFLLDEPLSNLDAKLRGQMRIELSKLHQQLGTTFIFVTHDQVEAMTLGTRIVVMKDGLIQQVDAPSVLYNKPKNLFVAGFLGSPTMNFVEALAVKVGDRVALRFGEYDIVLPDTKGKVITEQGYINKEVIMGIRPEDLHDEEVFLSQSPESTLEMYIDVLEMLGAETLLYMTCLGQNFTARVDPRSSAKIHEKIKLALDTQKIHVFDKDTEQVITN
jgi:multiple sugar transport system ATP-binding protein